MATEKKPIKISEVLELLQSGKDRKEIAKIYGLKPSERDRLFDHPELKGKKVHRSREDSFVIVDDVSTEAPATGTTEGNATAEATQNQESNEQGNAGSETTQAGNSPL